MHAGIAIGGAIALMLPDDLPGIYSNELLVHAGLALSIGGAINVAATRTVLATPIVMCSLSGRIDVLPVCLVASVTSLFATDGVSIIAAARHREAQPSTSNV